MIQTTILSRVYGPDLVKWLEAVTANTKAFRQAERELADARYSLRVAQEEWNFQREQLDISERELAAVLAGLTNLTDKLPREGDGQ